MSFLNNGHKLVYIHITKTGGVSMTRALYRSGLVNDLCYGRSPRSNVLTSRILKRLPIVPVPKKPGVARLKGLELVSSGHLSLFDFSQNIDNLDEYTVFALVRNPFAWLVSLFAFVNSVKNHPYKAKNPARFETFDNFIQFQCKNSGSQLDYIRNSCGRIGDVRTFKLEKMSENISELSSITGVCVVDIKKENVSKHRHYSEYYTGSLRQAVEKAYRSDLEELEYEFERE